MNVVKEKAFAKINLYLDVTNRREDGFHDIETIMHAVSLCDPLTVSFSPARETRVFVSVKNAPYIPSDDRNLAAKAAKLFCDYCGTPGVVHISLEKNIPVCAGLGGGSSDAAAVLRAMNKLLKYPLSTKILMKLAAQIGSDVPFCVLGKTALCTGKGELVTPVGMTRSLVVLIGIAKERISTPQAYGNLDRAFSDFDGSVPFGHAECKEEILSCIREDKSVESLYNIFETAVLPVCSGAATMKRLMLENGALCAALSGSGPAVFGIFKESETAQKCKKLLLECGYSAFLCYSA